LLRDQSEVIFIDNCYTGTKENIKELINNVYFGFIRHDITFPIYVEVNEIYNLACPASPTHYQFDPVQTTKTSVHGAINMLGLAKRVEAKILQAFKSELYGDPNSHPQKEEYWEILILLAYVLVMMKGSIVQRHFSSTISANTGSKSK
jgi:UDP-glucuronate decarboxylase